MIASKTKIHNSKEETVKAAYIAKKQSELDKIIALQKEEATLIMQ